MYPTILKIKLGESYINSPSFYGSLSNSGHGEK